MMKKLLLTIFISFFFSNATFAEDMSSIIINKFFENGQKVCKEDGLGEYLLTNNPITSIDISNDGINDLIIDESTQRCEKSHSIFAGGSAGNNFLFFINPTIDNVKAWDPTGFGGDKANNIYSMLIYGYEIVKWKDKNAIKIFSHGISCDVAGYIGCYSILVASEKGLEKVEGPKPNPQ